MTNKSLSSDSVNDAMQRVEGLWPDGLDAVPGTHEVGLKRDAETLRALAEFWREAQQEGLGSA